MSTTAVIVDPAEVRAQRLIAALGTRNITAEYAPTRDVAKAAVLARLPAGAQVMTGGSTSLDQLGIPSALRQGGFRYVRDQLAQEPDAEKRQRLRKEATLAPYFLGSASAVTEDGRIVAVDGTGSRIGAYAYGAGHVILVVSLNKVVPTLDAAFERVRSVAFPQEVERMKSLGFPGTVFGKWIIIEYEGNPGRLHVVLVDEPLGF